MFFPRYELDYDGKVVDHAHNDYIETLADLGIPGGLLGLAFLLGSFQEGHGSARRSRIRVTSHLHFMPRR